MANAPARRKAPHLAVVDGIPTTTSRDIAETFGKDHKAVLRRIRELDCSPEFHERNFAPMEIDVHIGGGNVRRDPAFRVTRDGFAFLCMGFTGPKAAQWKERYIAYFNRMEKALHAKVGKRAGRVSVASSENESKRVFDVEAALLSGQQDPHPLPPEIVDLLDRRAWELGRDAYVLLRKHLERRVAYEAVNAYGEVSDTCARNAIQRCTLGGALAHVHDRHVEDLLDVARLHATRAAQVVEELKLSKSQHGIR